jgi:hypothetical protein
MLPDFTLIPEVGTENKSDSEYNKIGYENEAYGSTQDGDNVRYGKKNPIYIRKIKVISESAHVYESNLTLHEVTSHDPLIDSIPEYSHAQELESNPKIL